MMPAPSTVSGYIITKLNESYMLFYIVQITTKIPTVAKYA